jgi:hypothetical protein
MKFISNGLQLFIILILATSVLIQGEDNRETVGSDGEFACDINEEFTECASSTCFEETCDDVRTPPTAPRKCTKDCRQGCRCKQGYYRNFDGRCVDELTCIMCGYGEEWLDCGSGRCQDQYDLTCDNAIEDSGDVYPIETSGCKCGVGYYRTEEGLCVSKEACAECGPNEVWETCGSSSCWEFTCSDSLIPVSERWLRPCTMDCRSGCKCHPGFYRDEFLEACVTFERCDKLLS